MTSNQDSTEHIHNLDDKSQEAISAFLDREQHRLDVVLEKYSWHGSVANHVGLLRHGILIGEDVAAS